jgi:[acyl-carrier-protein] S-malonyltransferase
MNFAALFPGQGSQNIGMGQKFFEHSELAKDIFSTADKILGFSLSKLCFEGPIEKLTLTEHAQPAILTASYIAFMHAELTPVAAAGHSLGEYSALVSAKALSFEDAVMLVHKRGKYMQEAVPAGQGKMIAVMGATDEQIKESLAKVTTGVAEAANYNSPGQVVIAGSSSGIEQFSEIIKTVGAKVIPLNVSAPFHCSLMKPAADNLSKDLDAISFSPPLFPIYCNTNAQATSEKNALKESLKKQVTSSVLWTTSMQNLIAEQKIKHCVEFGSGGVLSKLLKRIDASVKALEISDPETLEKTKAAQAAGLF